MYRSRWEEGYGVELIIEPEKNDTVLFHIEPWLSRADRITCGKEILDRRELIKAFHDGIVDFIKNTFIPSNWSLIDDLSYQNWGALLQEKIEHQDWNKRLLISGFKTFPDEQNPETIKLLHIAGLCRDHIFSCQRLLRSYIVSSIQPYKNTALNVTHSTAKILRAEFDRYENTNSFMLFLNVPNGCGIMTIEQTVKDFMRQLNGIADSSQLDLSLSSITE